MVITRTPFTPTKLQEEREGDGSRVIPLRLNKEEVDQLEADARYLEQEKISTALKQLAMIGHIAIHDPKTKAVLDTVFINRRRNQRLGIGIADPDFKRL
jgi:hypothetical protein